MVGVMAIRSIPAPVGRRGTRSSAVATAFQVPGRCKARVEGLHVRPELRDNPLPVDEGMTNVRIQGIMTALTRRIGGTEREARMYFDEVREQVGAGPRVMGARAHARVREPVARAVTRHVLGQAACPVLMAH